MAAVVRTDIKVEMILILVSHAYNDHIHVLCTKNEARSPFSFLGTIATWKLREAAGVAEWFRALDRVM